MGTLATAAFVLLATAAPTAPQSPPRLVVQLGHSAPINAVAYSPDGRYVVTGSEDATAKLWDAATGDELRTFAGHTDDVAAVAFSPDGRQLLTGSRDKTAKLWDIATGDEVREFPHGNGWILAVAFSPDGRIALTGGWDSVVTLWDTSNGKALRTLEKFEKGITSIAVSSDGRFIVTGSSDFTARLWDAATGAALRTFSGHTNTVTDVAFSPDSSTVATSSWDCTIGLWDVSTGALVRTLAHHDAEVTAVAFSPDGSRLLSGSRDMTAVLWDARNGKALGAASGHLDWISSVAFSPDGRYLLTASHDKTTRRWDSRGEEPRPLMFEARTSGLWTAAWSPDGLRFATADRDGRATLWNPVSGQPGNRIDAHEQGILSVTFSPDGHTLATTSWDHTAKLWSVRTGELLATLAGHEAAVAGAVFSPDGRLLVTRGWDKSAKVWNVATRTEVHSFPKERPVESAVFSPDGRYLITGWNAAARVWDTQGWTQVRVLGPHTFDFEMPAVAVSPDGRVVLTASGDSTAKLWNAGSGAALRTLSGHTDQIRSAVFSPDGRYILTGSSDRTAKLWNASTGAEVRTFAGHSGWVIAAVFSQDAKFILTASADGTARLWRTESPRVLATLITLPAHRWAVVDREGRFDAWSAGRVEGVHWVLENAAIELDDLTRYYEPYLLAKLLNNNPAELDSVDSFDTLGTPPELTIHPPPQGAASVKFDVAARSGGIGAVRVFLNSRLISDDACRTRNGTARARVACEVELGTRFALPGRENRIDIEAFNASGHIPTRGSRPYIAPGPPDAGSAPPRLFAIVVGVGAYASPAISPLAYAGKDARDLATAVELAAGRLLGGDRVHLTLLATGQPTAESPTKENIRRAFETIVQAALPNDILLVYLAGHGVMVGGEYVFPASTATTVTFKDPKDLEENGVTGTELDTWLDKIRALKQVMIVDTCHSGALNRFSRSDPGDVIEVFDRLRRRHGYHILMGSAAGAESFEEKAVEQGLLTYALLEGMRGAALRAGEYVDVSLLFQHAADRVPRLAKVYKEEDQYPQYIGPRHALSFDIGRIHPDDHEKFPGGLVIRSAAGMDGSKPDGP